MDSQATWTAARANRLLRPLASKITAFQKHIQEFRAGEGVQDPSRWSKTESSGIRDMLLGLNTTPEQDWIARRKGRRRRGIKYRATTAHDGKISQTRARQESEDVKGITLSTPYVRRDLSNGVHFPSSPHWKDGANKPELSSRIKRLGKPDALSLLKSFDHVLQATKRDLGSKITDGKTGAKSLSKMCLRLVPEHILDEQQYRLALDPDDRSDVTAEVFADLEEFDSITVRHNSAVRRGTRAHAVHMFTCLMSDANIDLASMYDLCSSWILQQLLPEEIESMISTWMHAHLSRHARHSIALTHLWSSILMPFEILQDVQSRMRERDATFTYRILTKLISSRSLCIEALGHPKLHYIWRGAMRSICMNTAESVAAANLVETLLNGASGVCPEATTNFSGLSGTSMSMIFLQSRFDWRNIDFEDVHEECFSALLNTVQNICVSLVALCHVRQINTFATVQNESATTNLSERILLSSARQVERSYGTASFARRAGKTGFPLIAAVVALAGLKCRYALKADSTATFLDRMVAFHEIRNLATSYVFADAEVDLKMTDFLLAVQACVERLCSSTVTRGHYEPYLDSISRSDISHDDSKASNAFAYISSLRDSSHKDHETRKPDQLLSHLRSHAPKPKTSHGFRWEEGIDEWVAMTPANFTPDDNMQWHLPRLQWDGKGAAGSSTVSNLSLDGQDDRVITSDADNLPLDTDQTLLSSPPELAPSDNDLDDLASPRNEESEDELAQQDSPSMFRTRKRAHSGGVSHVVQRFKNPRLG